MRAVHHLSPHSPTGGGHSLRLVRPRKREGSSSRGLSGEACVLCPPQCPSARWALKLPAPWAPSSLVTQPWGWGSSRLEVSAHRGPEQRPPGTVPVALAQWIWGAFLTSPQQLTVLVGSGDHNETDRLEGVARGAGVVCSLPLPGLLCAHPQQSRSALQPGAIPVLRGSANPPLAAQAETSPGSFMAPPGGPKQACRPTGVSVSASARWGGDKAVCNALDT